MGLTVLSSKGGVAIQCVGGLQCEIAMVIEASGVFMYVLVLLIPSKIKDEQKRIGRSWFTERVTAVQPTTHNGRPMYKVVCQFGCS